MEPIGLAVGVLGLAGLFSACMDAVERFDSWRHFSDESRTLQSRWETQKLRMKRWGQAVGIDNREASPDHHEALENPEIDSRVREHLVIIENLCTNGDGAFSSAAKTSAGQARHALFSRGRAHAQPSPASESGRQRVKWALRDKAKCTAQVEMLGLLVQDLYDLVPPDGAKGTKRTEQRAGNDVFGHMDDNLSSRDPWPVKLGQILAKIEKDFEAETRKKVHAWLLGRDIPNELFDDAVQRRVDGTCNWILEQSSFLEWISPDFPAGSAKILWVNGARGFGKTILCARVVEHLRSTLDIKPAHFFFSSDFESRRDPFVAVRSWLAQLLSHPAVLELARKEWEAHDSQVATRAEVVKVFRKTVVALPGCTFVLDGLDECAGMGQAWDADHSISVATFLETVQRAVDNTNTRLLIVCRDEPEIRQAIIRSGALRWFDFKISCDHVQADNALYSRSIVDQKLQNKPEVIKSDISQRLADRCNGQFLWIKMQEPSLRSGKNKKQLEAAIDMSPAGLDHLYDRDWQRLLSLPKAESLRAVSLLRWAAFALRPLTIDEITEALLITEDNSDFPTDEMPDSIDEDYIDGEILGLCGSLVEIRNVASESSIGSRTVHLAHFSVKEFFISRMSDGASIITANEHLRKSSEATQSSMLAMMCLRYVNFPRVWKSPNDGANQATMSFVHYAAGSWYQHAAMSKPCTSDIVQLTNALFSEYNEQYRAWEMWYDINNTTSEERGSETESTPPNPLYYASLLHLRETVEFLLKEQTYDINRKSPSGTTALSVSCSGGNLQIVAMLLTEGANTTIASGKGLTPLYTACAKGHLEVVQLLLEKGADIMAAREDSHTPLSAACLHGHTEVARLLLKKGADVMAVTKNGWTALHIASLNGYIELVRLLLEKGADVMAVQEDGWTMLFAASQNGHVEVARLLLEKGADVMAVEEDGWTALHVASLNGHIEVARLLLEKGADVEAVEENGFTALHVASQNGYIEVARLLLDKGADLMAIPKNGRTVLYGASQNGHVEVARLLLEKGADVMAVEESGWTALHIASLNGHIEMARLLLEEGADAEAIDANERTALFWSCARGHMEVTEHLLLHKAVPNKIDCYGATPLFAAARNAHEQVVAYLFAMECDIGGFRDSFERTLLWWASKSGNAQVIKTVLQFAKRNGIHVCRDDLAAKSRPAGLGESSRWCDICTRFVLDGNAYYKCPDCQGNGFDVCEECFEMGARCRSGSHSLLLRQPATC